MLKVKEIKGEQKNFSFNNLIFEFLIFFLFDNNKINIKKIILLSSQKNQIRYKYIKITNKHILPILQYLMNFIYTSQDINLNFIL